MVVALAGRRIDAEGTDSPRFPPEHVEKVREKLRQFFLANKPDWLVCSGACGADLVALEVAGQLNIRRKMVLPFGAETFRATSVIDRGGNWGLLFDSVFKDLNKESNVVVSNYGKDDDNVYEKANFDILKTADAIAKDLTGQNIPSFDLHKEKKVAVIIWEGVPKNSNDTTNHFRQEAMKRGYEIVEINSLH